MKNYIYFKIIFLSIFLLFCPSHENYAQGTLKKFYYEFLTTIDPDAYRIRKLINKINKISDENPNISDLDLIKDIWNRTNEIEYTKWKKYPKSYRLLVAKIHDKWYNLEVKIIAGDNSNTNELCHKNLGFWKNFAAENKENGDLYLLSRYEKVFGFDANNIKPWADSLVIYKANNCYEEEDCPSPYCGDKLNKSDRHLTKYFHSAYKFVNSVEEIRLDSIQVHKLWKDFLNDGQKYRKKKEISFSGGEIPLINSITEGLINDALFYHETGALSKYEKQQSINDTGYGCAAKAAWQSAMHHIENICDEDLEKSLCVIIENTSIPVENIEKWINSKYLSSKDGCTRDTCLNPRAMNAAMELSEYYYNDESQCIFCTCTDTSYHEGFNALNKYSIEQIISNQDSCKTKRIGCTNECSNTYCETCTIHSSEDCGIDVCGCLDSTAVNYAYDSTFNATHPYFKKFYNPEIKNHNQELCLYTACMDTCSLNYHPRALQNGYCNKICGCTDESAENFNKEATHEDGSCIFSQKSELETVKEALLEFLVEEGTNDGTIDIIRNHLEFTYCGLNKSCLDISLDIDGKTIKMASERSGFKSGSYYDKIMEVTMTSLIDFFRYSSYSNFFETSRLNLYVIGEADDEKIRKKGIKYNGEMGAITTKYTHIHKRAPQTGTENIYALKKGNSEKNALLDIGSLIKKNIILALVRAYTVALPIKEFNKNANIFIGAKHNNEIGSMHRRVFFQLEFLDFFTFQKEAEEADTKEEINYKNNFLPRAKCLCKN